MFVGFDGKPALSSYHSLYGRLENLRKQVSGLRVDDAGEIRGILSMIDQHERDLGRCLLLLHATVETLVRNKVITAEQIESTASELDALDKSEDGRLDPALFRTEVELKQTPSAKLYLHRLENAPHETTTDFLKRLEDE